jgi:hypothetical protein
MSEGRDSDRNSPQDDDSWNVKLLQSSDRFCEFGEICAPYSFQHNKFGLYPLHHRQHPVVRFSAFRSGWNIRVQDWPARLNGELSQAKSTLLLQLTKSGHQGCRQKVGLRFSSIADQLSSVSSVMDSRRSSIIIA